MIDGILPSLSGAIRFTQHAQQRLKSDQVNLTVSEINRIQGGMDKAAEKGAKESLLLMEDKAFIVNAKDRVVITSINRERLRENVFTNIDSAVII
ncbi:MAG: TIGR02530 family flagellar biosynthesis protein [Elusimicrobiota bacterium]